MPKRAVRIEPDLDRRMQSAVKEQGYRSSSAFIRAAIAGALKARNETGGAEEFMAASFDRISREMRRMLRGQQALFTLVDALTKAFLTCVPEPSGEARAHSIARARARYARLMRTAASSMERESRSAMQGLIGGDDE